MKKGTTWAAIAATGTLLIVGGARASATPWDSLAREFGMDRPTAERAWCSFDQPICIHAAPGTKKSLVLAAGTTAERAMKLYRSLGLPPPMADGQRGGSMHFDIYLAPRGASRAYPDPVPSIIGFDRAAAFATVDTTGAATDSGVVVGCDFSNHVARVTAQGMLLAIDGALSEGILAAQSSWLAHGASPCQPLILEAIDQVQRRPDLAICSPEVSAAQTSGHLLFPWFLDDTYGAGTHGAVLTGLVAVSSQSTPLGNERYVNEPDVFDALRKVTRDRQMNFGELLVEYAIARAFVGDRSDDAHLLDVDWLDRAGRVRFEWSVAWADLPKRVAPAYPLEPTGAGYVWVDLAGKPADREVLVVMDWEQTHVFQWAVVRLDAAGREVGRHLVGGTFGEAQAQLQLRDLSDTSSLLIVGTLVGNDDRSQPYDPESGWPRLASYTVTVHPQ